MGNPGQTTQEEGTTGGRVGGRVVVRPEVVEGVDGVVFVAGTGSVRGMKQVLINYRP